MVSAVSSLLFEPDLVSAKDVYEGAWLRILLFGRETVGIFRLLREVLWVRI